MSQNKQINGRDAKTGQFQLGHTGMGGRPRGSRAKLGEAFVADLYAKWQKHGADVLDRVIRDDPAQFLKTISHVLPKELSAEIDVAVSVFHQIDDTNRAYKIAMDYLHNRIKAQEEGRLIEHSNGIE